MGKFHKLLLRALKAQGLLYNTMRTYIVRPNHVLTYYLDWFKERNINPTLRFNEELWENIYKKYFPYSTVMVNLLDDEEQIDKLLCYLHDNNFSWSSLHPLNTHRPWKQKYATGAQPRRLDIMFKGDYCLWAESKHDKALTIDKFINLFESMKEEMELHAEEIFNMTK